MHAVEAQQMRVGLDRPEIVDRDDFDVLAAGFHDGAQHVAPDAAETVDRHPYRHRKILLERLRPGGPTGAASSAVRGVYP